ncbi:dipeptidase PepV [Evansella tamaricis]|uniref:Dipeptidase PepV n=1 Tax=Evansella tamaricis TaxID=2069301 RepID=A0ABS6JGT7_9BACI|nr:dipeptidase PepV [Evansella tamaricis]MBU9712811.1 dipeptidase PepV [Evansella tamaricis]
MNWNEEVLKRKEDLLKDLTDLLKMESTKDSETRDEGKPMGHAIAKTLDFMLKLSSQQGFRTKNHEGFYGYGEIGPQASEEYVAVLTHLDVVPATGSWTSPPFEPTIRDGKLFARGVIDDKGPTMSVFYAIKLLKELEVPLKRKVRIIFGTDEESGMSCLRKYREVESPPTAGFAPDAMFPIINAEKGQINVKCVLKKTSQESEFTTQDFTLLSFNAGSRPNMVPETATAVLTGKGTDLKGKFTNYIQQNRVTGEFQEIGQEKWKLTVKGVSSHSMEPFKGVNAAVSLARFLLTLSTNQPARKYCTFINGLFWEDHFGEKLAIAHSDDITGPLTVNPAIFQYNSESSSDCYVHINIRYPVTATFENIETKLTDAIKIFDFSIGEIKNKNPHHVDKELPMIQALQEAYEGETNQKASLLSSGGNTYASLLPNCVAFGAVFPGKEMTAHQKDEYIEVDDLLKATAIYARSIYNLANM